MSRRKQSNPRQIKRSLGDMEATQGTQAVGTSLTEREATVPEPEPAGQPEPPSTPGTDTSPPSPPPAMSPGGSEEMEGEEPEPRPAKEAAEDDEEEEPGSCWSGPDELELVLQEGQKRVRARLSLSEGTSWGPFPGTIQTTACPPGQEEPSPALTLQLVDEACWLWALPRAPTAAEANLEICRKAEPHGAASHPVKEEPAEAPCLAPMATADIHLLPQQAGMASVLATAIINRDVFPCKDCGIWYRSERNLQAHLLYYCASRQDAGSPATATDEKPKEAYPHERICPFPQCRKSCPSASSLEIHMRSHSGERPFVCLICLSAFTTKANCERHLKVHTDTLSGVCHSCGFISTTRDILYSHLVTSHMVCQPGSKGEVYTSSTAHPAAKLPPDSLAGFQQHTALHGPRAPTDLSQVPVLSPGVDRKTPAEATNGEAKAGPQNGGSSEPVAVPKSVKVEATEEPEACRAPGPAETGPQAPSRTPSPRSPAPAKVKAELSTPTSGSSPVPAELGLAGTLFLPQYVFGADGGTAPPASEILAKMSELVHSRLQQGAGAPGTPKGATCFECEITFNNVNNYYVHKRLYCSGRRLPEDAPAARRPKPSPGQARAPPCPSAETDAARSPPGAREDEAGGAATPEPEAAGRGSEGSQSPGSSVDDAEDDPSRTLCEACNIRFSRHETYTVHKRYYCASRHDPPPRRPAPAAAPTPAAAPVRTRRRRKLYELHAAGPAPPGPAPAASEPPSPPRPGSGPGLAPAPARSPEPAPDGPIDLSKKPRRQPPDAGPAGLPALADYHECTACRVSFHSLEAYLAHKKYSCPAAPLRPGAREPGAVVCPYCPPNGRVRGDLIEHFRLAHGLLVGRVPAEPWTPADRGPSPSPGPRDSADNREAGAPTPPPAARSPQPGPPPASAPTPPSAHSDQGTQAPGKAAAPASGGNPRFCRLCSIRFSSLSTFIAHKKYYCSSHAAEHGK